MKSRVEQATPPAGGLRTLVPLLLILGVSRPAPVRAAILKEAGFKDNGRESVLMLRFENDPTLRYVPMTESRILILDFVQSVFPAGRETFQPKNALVEYMSLAQFEKDRLRLIIKVAPATVVNVYRHPVGSSPEIRYVVVVEKESALAPPVQREPGPKTVPRIVFDPGHGGHDNGALGRITSDKAVALAVALELKALFDKDPRVEAYFTRLSDHFVPLEQRTDYARKVKADLFVSLHANMMHRRPWVNGVEVWYLSPQGANQEMHKVLEERGLHTQRRPARRTRHKDQVDRIILSMQQSKALEGSGVLASILHRNLTHATGQTGRGVKRNNFRVLRPIEIPSSLIEFGFLSNQAEERRLAGRDYHRVAARAVYDAALEWLARNDLIRGPAARGLIKGPLEPVTAATSDDEDSVAQAPRKVFRQSQARGSRRIQNRSRRSR